MSGLLPGLEDPVRIEPADPPELAIPDSGIPLRGKRELSVPDPIDVGKGTIL